MSVLHFKGDVRFDELQPQMIPALLIVMHHFSKLGVETWITSGNDGEHKVGSLHYKGLALDFRTRDVTPSLLAGLVNGIRENLSPLYDVVLEETHLHVEYDPK